jgi:hypothetical protein
LIEPNSARQTQSEWILFRKSEKEIFRIWLVGEVRVSPPASCLETAVDALGELEDVLQNSLAFLSPLVWAQVNLACEDIWGTGKNITENTNGMMSLPHRMKSSKKQPDVHHMSAYVYPVTLSLVLAEINND